MLTDLWGQMANLWLPTDRNEDKEGLPVCMEEYFGTEMFCILFVMVIIEMSDCKTSSNCNF